MQSKPEACYMSPTQAAWRTSLHAEWEPSPGCFGLESGTNWYYSFHGIQNSSKAHRTCKTCKHNAITLRCGKPEPNRPFLPSCSSKRKITWKNIPRCIIFGALLGIHLWPSKTPRLVVFCMTESDDLESLFSSDTEVGLPWVTYEKLVKGFGRVHIVTLPTLLCNPTRNINGWRFF